MSRHPRSLYFCFTAVCLLSLTSSASFAGKQPVWIRLRSPNFIVVTDGSERQARHVAYQFEMIRAVLRNFFNATTTAADPPVIIIGARDEDSMKPMMPEAYQAKGAAHLAGIFVGGPEKNYVAVNLDSSLDRESYEPFETVYHEYVHYLMRRSISRLPLWLTEGLAEYFGNTRLEGKNVLVGTPSSTNLGVLREGHMLPLRTLFAVDASSPYYHEENKASIFYAESWVLTHYLMVKDWRGNTHHLNEFVTLLGQNVAPADAAKRTIGDPHALEAALEEYIRMLSFTVARVPAPGNVDEKAFTPEPLSESESLAVRADFLIHTRHLELAQRMLEQSLQADPKLAASHESMGLLYSEQNKIDEANKWYSQAVELNSQSYLANYYYATNLFKTQMDDTNAAKAEASLRTAIRLSPGFAPAYDALSYLLLSRQRELDEARTLVLQAVTLEPGNIRYRLRMVTVLEQMNQADDALRVATLAASMARTQDEVLESQLAVNSASQFQEFKQREHDDERGSTPQQAEASTHSGTQGESHDADSSGAPVLRHRDVARMSYGENPQVSPPASRERRELETKTETADGTILSSTCPDSKTLELTLVVANGSRQLYSDNYYGVSFSALNFTPEGVMNPCKDLNGMKATISYRPAKEHPDEGEIEDVQVRK